MMIASGTQARIGIGRTISNKGKQVVLEGARPAEQQAERHAKHRRQREGDRDALHADKDVLIIDRRIDRDAIGRVAAQPFLQNLREARHFGKARQLQHFD